MSYCLNPNCLSRQNPDDAIICQHCKSRLLLNDRYHPLYPIGRGGFGSTFLARDAYKPSKPNCVIKQFHGKGLEDAAKAEELFHREAELLDKLGKHLQIPELLAHFKQDDYLYLVQEFIDGQNLNQELKQEGIFSEEKVWRFLEELLFILQFVHQNNVIHRDIKPENIIRHRTLNKLFLVDFGIAKNATEATFNKTGTVIGSEGYTAPEQHEGKPALTSDLYSLGATCYHLITRSDPSRLLYAWVDWQKELRENLERRDISYELICIVTKLLQPNINQRYQSVEEVLQDLHLEENYINTESPIIFCAPKLKPNIESWKCVNTLTGHDWDVLTVAISPDSQTIASGSTDHTIKIWNLQTGKLLSTKVHYITEKSSADIHFITFSPNGKTVVSGSWGHSGQTTIHLWELSTMKVIQTLPKNSGWVNSITFSPDGQTLASGGRDQAIKLWNLDTGKLIKRLEEHSRTVNSITFNPNGRILASGSADKTIKIWNIPTGELLNTFAEHFDSVNSVAISPDGQILASSSADTTIKIWNITTGEVLNTFAEHLGSVKSVAISPDGQILASGSTDNTIKIWHLATGELLKTFKEHSQSVNSVTFSPNGQFLASASTDNTIKIWQCNS
ncbi:MAG: protein kinase domain-containing protein [Nostoc sp. ChiSLP01]|nr:serine/threonine-protein kinase [Nostoc sp. CmiSLP01]MDZ8287460.1 serine/threonine-protein kinase [Nostoc sp. ChiSLP01]